MVASADQLFLSYRFMEKCHKMSKYLVYYINSKAICDCLTWIVLYKELYQTWK